MAKHNIRFGAGVLAAAIAFAVAAPAFAAPAKDTAPTDRFIVKFKNGSVEHKSAAARRRVVESAGHGQGLHLGKTRRLAVGADLVITDRKLDHRAAQAFLRKLKRDPNVEYVQVDRRLTRALTPNDTQYSQQWHYSDPLSSIRANTAWNTATGTGIVVAVLDTGITDHPDLDANILPGYDFISADDNSGVPASDFFTANDGDGRDADAHDPGDWTLAGDCGVDTPSDSSWHGTHVAGTVAAVTNNARGVAGVAFGAKVQPVRVLGRCGGYTSDIADAIIWASGGTVPGVPANPTPAEVINMSLGGGGSCDALSQAAINLAVANGTTVVVAAGNDASDAAGHSPASCDNVITVAATTKTGGRAGYSNFGDVVDVGAPGGNGSFPVLSTLNAGKTTPSSAVEFYAGYTGTSMASPHVAGVAALMQSVAYNTPDLVEAILKGSARAFPATCNLCGTGLVTAPDALGFTTSPFLYISDLPGLVEGDTNAKVVSFKVRLSAALAHPVTFDIATADDTATAGSDYIAKSTTGATIPAGQLEASFLVTVKGDDVIEAAEQFKVIVSNVVGANTLQDVGKMFIINDDGPILEDGETLTGLSAPLDTRTLYKIIVPHGATSLTFTTTGAADQDVDIYARHGLPPTTGVYDEYSWGVDTNEQISIANPAAGTWYLLLHAFSEYSNVSLTADYTGGSTAGPNLTINDVSVTEGNSGTKVMTFTASLSQPTTNQVQFLAGTADGTATQGSDYVALSDFVTEVTIPPGQLSATISVTINGDVTVEADETLFLNLSQVSGATPLDGQGTGTITNDDGNAVPTLAINNASVSEGNSGTKLLTFTASLSQAAANAVTFNAATQSGTATVGSDFVGFPPTGFTIPAGQLSTLVSVTVNGDTAVEPNETFNVNLSSVAGATLFDGQGVGTITNDDTASAPTLSINDVSLNEGNFGTRVLAFTVSLSQAAATTVTFNAATQSGTATVGSDFVGFTPTGFSIAAGQLAKAVVVTINSDTAIEPTETFKVNLSSVVGATLRDGQGVGTITNDDTSPTLSINDVSLKEGNFGTRVLAFTVSLSQATNTTVTFNAATQSGTATVGSDFVGFAPTGFSIAAGQLAKAVVVTLNSDTTIEPTETFKVNLSSAVGATLLDGQGVGTITNDDVAGLAINNVTISEGNAGTKVLSFTASLNQAHANAVTFNAATQSATATVGSDFVGFTPTGFTIPAGQLTATINVTIKGDTTVEANETLNVNLSSVSGTTLLDGQGVGTITNDD